MTETTTPTLAPGDRVHVLYPFVWVYSGDGLTARSDVLETGTVVTLTAEMIERNSHVLALLDDPDAQEAKFRRVVVGRGDWPAHLETWTYGTPEWATAREAARQAAWKLDDESLRNKALRGVEKRFGQAPTNRTTQQLYGGR